MKMSEINTSITSDILPPLHCSSFKLTPEDGLAYNKNETTQSKDIMNNLKANVDVNAEINLAKMNNNNNLHQSKNPYPDVAEQKKENKDKLLKLKITNHNEQRSGPVLNVVNNLSNEQVAIEKKISELVITLKARESSSSPKSRKPVMGQVALLKKAKTNMERNDSLIIHDLITSRYNGALNHYYNRMYQRRNSKIYSSEDEYSDTVFSSPPNCSPMSVSSIDTPYSTYLDERNRFTFPRHSKGRTDLHFLRSTDDANIDTTAEDLDTSSLNSSAVSNDKSITSFSEYDPKKFLENAIGDVTNVSSESGFFANDKAERKERQKIDDYSVGPSDISSLISRKSGLYSSLKRSNSMTLQTSPQRENHIKDNRQSFVSDNSLLDNLMKELSVQNEIMFQISKALNYCRTIKGFETAVEFIEAEKILLVASSTKVALTKEIENIDDDTYEKKDDPRSCGQIYLSHFNFFPKNESKSNTHRDLIEQFVLILTCGSTVLASDVIVADENGVVHVEKTFEFKKLATDFEISICIYAMKVRNKQQHNQEQSHCPSPKKFFLNKVSRKYKVTNENLYIKPSLFLPWGKCEIRSPDLSRTKSGDTSGSTITLKMYNIPLSSSLSGIFSMDIKSNVKLCNKMRGFLTIGLDNENSCTIWNRRWCVLEGAILKYWNYPSEEVTDALGSLDLHYCLEQQISAADRSVCARSRTLMVPVKHKEGERKYLLAADNLSEMKLWEKELNYVIRVLSLWKCGATNIP